MNCILTLAHFISINKTSKHFPSNQYRHLRCRSLWSLWGFRIRSRRLQRSCG